MGLVVNLLVALQSVLRPMVLWIVQFGVSTLFFGVIDFILNKMQDVVRDYYGIDDQSAGAVFANLFLDVLTFVGIGTAVMSKKIPIKVADRMGLTKSGWKKQAVSVAAAVKIAAKDKAAGGKGFKLTLTKVLAFGGVFSAPIWLTSAIANMIEPGIYKPEQTNAVYRALGIPFQFPTSSASGAPGGFEPGDFTDYHRALETAGAKFVDNPCKAGRFPFSRAELTALVDCIYGQEAAKPDGSTTPTKLKKKLAQYIVMSNGSSAPEAPPTSGGSTGTPSQATSYTIPKVYTGVISQGVLGAPVPFSARPDDLIESETELRAAAANNLAATLSALPGSLSYEIKIVPSVITKDGFKQSGAAQQVVSGTNKDGTKKYKTVVNKFAVLSVFLMNEKGVRTKVRQITLGPTDVVKFNPTAVQIAALEQGIKSDIVTTDPEEIEEIEGRAVQPEPEQENKWNYIMGAGYQPPQYNHRNTRTLSNGTSYLLPDRVSNGISSKKYEDVFGSYTPIIVGSPEDPLFGQGDGSVKRSDVPGNPQSESATNLSEYYSALGKTLPSVSQRAAKYEELGLGQANFYTGTAEQNAKLLSALKASD